ncbi:DUF736 domain-containing protein [Sphingobium algorifonticola]|jgi:uncharacterized protein (DUF736 family)|uniref:DUF736 domain-containing protein n=1 Tax=Sphingobium algorifonticola TaxID=2008318 RepID=A0A437J364_9SPHN|nr:DUF736 domain-containing protein [Sphingobium algorifonticola]RVT38740.1 DUF736 domain-containing protein [Sphingobium algorifonticola]
MRIGTFRAAGGGYNGQLRTLSLSIEISLVPADLSDSENAPDFRVVAGEDEGAREIGAGWKHVGEKAGDYVSLQIDDPSFLQPLRANLFKGDDDGHVLVWSRPSRREKAN